MDVIYLAVGFGFDGIFQILVNRSRSSVDVEGENNNAVEQEEKRHSLNKL